MRETHLCVTLLLFSSSPPQQEASDSMCSTEQAELPFPIPFPNKSPNKVTLVRWQTEYLLIPYLEKQTGYWQKKIGHLETFHVLLFKGIITHISINHLKDQRGLKITFPKALAPARAVQ